MSNVCKIENHTVRFISLVPTDSFPSGFTLNPGMNSVPRLFYDELISYEVPCESRSGRKATRFPGRDALKQLAEVVMIAGDGGNSRRGPQVTVHPNEDGSMDHAPDGLPMPYDLSRISQDNGAILFVQRVTDVEALRRWVTTEAYRAPVTAAVQARLGQLSGGQSTPVPAAKQGGPIVESRLDASGQAEYREKGKL